MVPSNTMQKIQNNSLQGAGYPTSWQSYFCIFCRPERSSRFPGGGIRRGEAGFTLVEIMMSLTLLLIMALAFIPLFIYVTEGSQTNRVRVAATAIATGVIEEIRALPYDRVGTVGGNPAGVLEPEREVEINGVKATVKVRVWWVDDPSDDDEHGRDPIPYDYKRVQVTVESPSLFTGKIVRTADIRTLAALEGEEEAYPGGNIRVWATRGEGSSADADALPCAEVKTELTSGPDAPRTLWTDDTGQVLFAVLKEGTYTVTIDASALGMMVRPNLVEQTVEVVEAVTTEIPVEVDVPGYLTIIIELAGQEHPVESQGEITLTLPVVNPGPDEEPLEPIRRTRPFDFSGEMTLPAEFLGELWPAGGYDLEISGISGYETYVLSQENENSRCWDGIIQPGETKNITVTLTPVG